MLIIGRFATYDVRWGTHGYSYAKAFIYQPAKKLWVFSLPKKLLHECSSTKHLSDVEQYGPQEMISWFTSEVDQYETRKEQWDNYYEVTAKEGPPRTLRHKQLTG